MVILGKRCKFKSLHKNNNEHDNWHVNMYNVCFLYSLFQILFFGAKIDPFFKSRFSTKKRSIYVHFPHFFLLLKQSYICGNNIFQEISSPWGIKLSIWIMKFLLSRLQSPRVKNLSCEILIAKRPHKKVHMVKRA